MTFTIVRLYIKGSYTLCLKHYLDTSMEDEIFVMLRDNIIAFKPENQADKIDVINKCKDYMDEIILAPEDKIKALEEKVEGLEAELEIVIDILHKVSPKHHEWIKLNFPNFKEI